MANAHMIHISKSILLDLQGIYATFFCTSHPFVQFKAPGSFAPGWTIVPAPSWHQEKCHCTTYGTYGTNVSMERRSTQTWLRFAWFALRLFAMKNIDNNISPNPTFFWVNVENNSLGYPWYDSKVDPFHLHLSLDIRLWSRLLWRHKPEHLHEHMWSHLSNLQYPTTKTPFSNVPSNMVKLLTLRGKGWFWTNKKTKKIDFDVESTRIHPPDFFWWWEVFPYFCWTLCFLEMFRFREVNLSAPTAISWVFSSWIWESCHRS